MLLNCGFYMEYILCATLFDCLLECFTALFTKPPDGLLPYRTGSGGRSVWQFPIDIFLFCRERPVTKEPGALRIGLLWTCIYEMYC